MKNLFKTTFYVCVFALAGILFQLSCSNSENESNPAAAAPNKILYTQYDAVNGFTIWYYDIDGSNPTQVPVALPAGTFFQNANANGFVRFSPDGQKILFVVNNTSNKIYSCNLDGSNLGPVVSPTNAEMILIGDVM